MKKDFRVQMSLEELNQIQPYEDALYHFYNFETMLMGPVFDEVSRSGKTEEIVAQLTKGQQYFYALIELISQVYNGGVGQYFFNKKGKLTATAIEALKLLGMLELAESLNQTFAFYQNNLRDLEGMREKDDFGGFVKPFRQLDFDDKLYAHTMQTQEMMILHIKNHPDEFIREK